MFIADGTLGLHIGLLYRSAKKKAHRALHLAWHRRLTDQSISETVNDKNLRLCSFIEMAENFDPIELTLLAAHCSTLARRGREDLAYGFRYAGAFDQTGKFTPAPRASGLTCSTFVVAIFDWAAVALIDHQTWLRRDNDEVYWRQLVGLLKESGAEPAHIRAVHQEINSVRFRPEEVAASCACQDRPVKFNVAEAAGDALMSAFYAPPPA